MACVSAGNVEKSATACCRSPSVRIVRSIGSVAGPAISDSRPDAARRISSIWNIRSRACRNPRAITPSCSDPARMRGTQSAS
jgi:hypothetical protein